MSRAAQARGHRPDYLLALATLSLLAIGLVIIYSISPILVHKAGGGHNYFYGQLTSLLVASVFWIVGSRIPYQTWRRYSSGLMALALIVLAALLIPGLSSTKNGATRWLEVGSFSFQPAEALKLALVVYLAAWFEKRRSQVGNLAESVMPFGLMMLVISIVIVVLQRDMGTMLVLAIAALAMFYVAGIRLRHLLALTGTALALGLAAIVSFPHRLQRLTTFLDPGGDPTGQGYHINQALIAIGSGGLLGVGLGKSVQVYGYLPEAANDSIFAVIAEEFGLVGSVVVLALFGLLVWRGYRIAQSAPDDFSRLVATGITTWLLFQAVINIAAMLSLIPLTGIPLPFISYGGSSLVFLLLAVGILFNVSRYTVKEAAHARVGFRRRNSWSYFADSRHLRGAKSPR